MAFAAVLTATSLSATAQTSLLVQDKSASGFRLHQTVEEVLLYCTVVDRKGQLVTDLDRSAFEVREDKHPVAIGQFSSKDTPVSLALVLDDSESMRFKHGALVGAAAQLIGASRHGDELSLTSFADDSYLDQELTADQSAVQHALSASSTIAGGTALFDTLITAANHLSTTARNGKRVVVVISDGRDNASGASVESAIARVQQTDGPMIYAIGLDYDLPGADARRARKDLKSLAEETGGVAIFPGSSDEVPKAAAEIARDIRHQYRLAFHPLPETAMGGYHAVVVRASASGRGRLSVRTRKGFARPLIPSGSLGVAP